MKEEEIKRLLRDPQPKVVTQKSFCWQPESSCWGSKQSSKSR